MRQPAGANPAEGGETRWLVLLSAVYVVVASVVKASAPFPDLTDFWVPAARLILEGRPHEIYGVRLAVHGHEFPNAYPPVLFLLVTPMVALADALGLAYGRYATPVGDGFGDSLVGLPLLLGDVALAWLVQGAARERLARADRLWLFAALLVAPPLWFSSVKVQHHESMLLAALVGAALALERGRDRPAVACAALALCLKGTALVALPALVLTAALRGRPRTAAALALVPPLCVGALLAPWLWARWDATLYSLVHFEGLRPIFGISAAKLASGTALEAAVVRLSNPALLAGAALLSAVVLRRGGSLRQALCCAQLVALLLSRWVYPHYLLVPWGLLLFWELERPSFPRLSVVTCGLWWALQTPYYPEVALEGGLAIQLRAAAWALCLLGLLLYVATRSAPALSAGPPGLPEQGRR